MNAPKDHRPRLGFIGVGGYGAAQIELFLAHEEPRWNVVGLADSSPDALKRWDGVEMLSSARRFRCHGEMLDAIALDAVVISVPIPWHDEVCRACLEKSLPVLLEKPPVPLLDQLDDLIARDVRERVMVGFQRAYSGVLDCWAAEGLASIGGHVEDVSIAGAWPRNRWYFHRSPWAGKLRLENKPVFDGPCTNAMSHFIDLGLRLAGNGLPPWPIQIDAELYRARKDIESYDTAVFQASLEGGVPFGGFLTHACPRAAPVLIGLRGPAGIARLDNDGARLVLPDGREFFFPDGRALMEEAFFRLVRGNPSANRTPLRSARAYVAFGQQLVLSTGRIRDVPERYTEILSQGTDEETLCLRDLLDAEGKLQVPAEGHAWRSLQPTLPEGGSAVASGARPLAWEGCNQV